MKSSFCIDLQRFMLIPTKFPLSHFYTILNNIFIIIIKKYVLIIIYFVLLQKSFETSFFNARRKNLKSI